MGRTETRTWALLVVMAIAAIAVGAQESRPEPREQPPPAAPSQGDDPTDAVNGTLVEGGARRFTKQGVALDADLVQVAAKPQVRGVLFDEQTCGHAAASPLTSGWMWFGLWALAGVVCAAAASYVALSKGIAPLPWMVAALPFNVVPLLLVALKPAADLSRLPQGVPAGLAKIATTRAPVACAKCGAPHHPTATRCSDCGAPLAASGVSEVARAQRPNRGSST